MVAVQSPARRGLRLRAVEGLVWLSLAIAVATGLSVLLGPNGLGLLQYQPSWPVVGDSAYQMGAQATLNDDAGVVVRNTPGWTNTSDGTRDAATGLPPVEVTGPFTAKISLLNAAPVTQWTWVAWHVGEPLLVAGWLLVVVRLLRSFRLGRPFTAANADRLRTLALLVGVGGTVASVGGEWVRRWLLDSSAAAGIVEQDWSVNVTPLLAGLLLWVLADVWRTRAEAPDRLIE